MNIGTLVRYRLTDEDVRQIKFRRARAVGWAGDHEIKAGDDFPAMVMRNVAVGVLDLRVFLNGTDDLWRPSVSQPVVTDLGDGKTSVEYRGAWQEMPTDVVAPPADPPVERTVRVNPGEAPRTIKTQKDASND